MKGFEGLVGLVGLSTVGDGGNEGLTILGGGAVVLGGLANCLGSG